MKTIQNIIITLSFFLFSTHALLAQPYKDYIGAGHNAGITVTASSSSGSATAAKTIDGSGMNDRMMQMSRFMSQATLGANNAQISSALSMGYENWITDQFTKAPTLVLPKMNTIWNEIVTLNPEAFGPAAIHFNYAWWDNNMTNQDLLRQKVAYALSQILVTSINSDLGGWGEAVSSYYDIFINNAFGNYRDILGQVSRHPAMGYYLSHLNNPKTDLANNIRPDENYAREIMQLFTIGLYMLNQNGTQMLDGNNNPIPTYNNDDIKQMAKIFTGLYGIVRPCPAAPYPPQCVCWSNNNPPSCANADETCCWWPTTSAFGNNIYVLDRTQLMLMSNADHETGPKTMPGGAIINIPNNGMAEVNAAIDFLFNHQNTPPFVSYRLIQRLVKSNPTPAYVSRVAAKFINNGQGVRGDMKAVIKQILLDEEARNSPGYHMESAGKLREPLLRYTHVARALPTESDRNRYWNNGYNYLNDTKQHVMASPTVFNFYLPDFQPVGEITEKGWVAPEFKLHNTATSVGYINSVYGWSIWNNLMYSWEGGPWPTNPDNGRLVTTYLQSISNDSEVLINELDMLFTHGQLSDETRQVMRNALNPLHWNWDQNSPFVRTRLALYLLMISPDYNCVK